MTLEERNPLVYFGVSIALPLSRVNDMGTTVLLEQINIHLVRYHQGVYMTAFEVSVTERPLTRLVGLTIKTDMVNAKEHCTQLWGQTFLPRMPEITGKPAGEFQGASYGVSIMLDEQHFAYWAALPLCEGRPIPEGMQTLELPAGLYAQCEVPSLAQLGEAYTWLYGQWAQSDQPYAINMQAPCFEYYDENSCATGSLKVFVPVVRRS